MRRHKNAFVFLATSRTESSSALEIHQDVLLLLLFTLLFVVSGYDSANLNGL